MLIIRHTVETNEPPAKIWQVLEDVENWKNWDREIESCHLDGPFQTGTSGYLKLKGSPRLNTLLTHVGPFSCFVQEAKLFLATAVMTHSIVHDSGQAKVTFQTEIRGPLALLYSCFIGDAIKKKVPIEMEEMLKHVRLTKGVIYLES
jgi:Polyketide cyclase / dehydrase and lipid transport